MSNENENIIDYGAVLADLEAKRAALDTAIASIRAAMGALSVKVSDMAGNLTDVHPIVALRGIHNGEVPAGAFFKKSIIEATKLYLSLVKKKKTTREIAEALKQGGMESASKNFGVMVGILLRRASKTPDSGIVKLADAWGLSDWYPAGFRLTQEKSGEKAQKKKGKGRKKTKKAKNKDEKKMTGKSPVETPAPESKGLEDRITAVLSSNATKIFSSTEIAESLHVKAGVVSLALGRMAAKNKAEKVGDGKYRAPSGKLKEMPKAV